MEQDNKGDKQSGVMLDDIIGFIAGNKRQLIIGAVLGIAAATVYVGVSPKVYEAKWQMTVAHMVAGVNDGEKTRMMKAEEPEALVQRLKLTSAYPAIVVQECEIENEDELTEFVRARLKVQVVKNVEDMVEFRLRAESKGGGTACAEAIVAMVVEQQQLLIQDYQAGKQEQLIQYQKSFQEEMQLLDKLKYSDLGNFGYLAKLDKISWLRTRIDTLQESIFLSTKYPAKLTSNIEVSNHPVSPKRGISMLLGSLLGMLLGALWIFARKHWVRKAF